MSAEIELWSVELKGGSEEAVIPPTHIRLTNASFGEELADANGRSVIKLAYKALSADDSEDEEDEENDEEDNAPNTTTILTALTAGKTEQSVLNLVLLEDRQYILTNTGKNTVYLTGNYIEVSDEPPYDDEDEFDDEDAYDLEDVSSDVEMHPDDIDIDSDDAERFEEIVDEEPKAAKRPRESDAEKPKEKKNKKQKAEDGKPVAVADEIKKAAEKKDEKKEKKKEAAPEKKQSKVRELPGGLKIEDTKIGDGPEAKKGARVGMRYVGKLLNGSIFDKNVKGKPFYFKVGKGEVIKGWDEGIPGMKVGGERILTVPASMAYGNKKLDGIPANSTLRFEVKLLEIK